MHTYSVELFHLICFPIEMLLKNTFFWVTFLLSVCLFSWNFTRLISHRWTTAGQISILTWGLFSFDYTTRWPDIQDQSRGHNVEKTWDIQFGCQSDTESLSRGQATNNETLPWNQGRLVTRLYKWMDSCVFPFCSAMFSFRMSCNHFVDPLNFYPVLLRSSKVHHLIIISVSAFSCKHVSVLTLAFRPKYSFKELLLWLFQTRNSSKTGLISAEMFKLQSLDSTLTAYIAPGHIFIQWGN